MFIPYGGYYDYGQDNTRIGFNDWMWLWNSDCQSCLYAPDTMLYLHSQSVDCTLPVRCMKDDPHKPGTGDDYIVDDEYEW